MLLLIDDFHEHFTSSYTCSDIISFSFLDHKNFPLIITFILHFPLDYGDLLRNLEYD